MLLLQELFEMAHTDVLVLGWRVCEWILLHCLACIAQGAISQPLWLGEELLL